MIDRHILPRAAGPIAALLIGAAPLPAAAWGVDGHRIVCAIAWDSLTPAALGKVKMLLAIKTRDQFAEDCLWADQYRNEGHPETHDWHIVYVPPTARTVDVARDCPTDKSCVVVQIERDIAALKDPSKAADEKATALKFLSHFVGDVHEPLHVAFERDDSGAKINGTFLGEKMTLHTLWDEGLLKADGRPWPTIASQLESQISAGDRQTWTATTPVDWANESLAVTRAPATGYGDGPAAFAFGPAYRTKNLPVVLDRLARAGVRLAHVLNTTFGR